MRCFKYVNMAKTKRTFILILCTNCYALMSFFLTIRFSVTEVTFTPSCGVKFKFYLVKMCFFFVYFYEIMLAVSAIVILLKKCFLFLYLYSFLKKALQQEIVEKNKQVFYKYFFKQNFDNIYLTIYVYIKFHVHRVSTETLKMYAGWLKMFILKQTLKCNLAF